MFTLSSICIEILVTYTSEEFPFEIEKEKSTEILQK